MLLLSGAWVEETNCQSFDLIRIVVLGTEKFHFFGDKIFIQ